MRNQNDQSRGGRQDGNQDHNRNLDVEHNRSQSGGPQSMGGDHSQWNQSAENFDEGQDRHPGQFGSGQYGQDWSHGGQNQNQNQNQNQGNRQSSQGEFGRDFGGNDESQSLSQGRFAVDRDFGGQRGQSQRGQGQYGQNQYGQNQGQYGQNQSGQNQGQYGQNQYRQGRSQMGQSIGQQYGEPGYGQGMDYDQGRAGGQDLRQGNWGGQGQWGQGQGGGRDGSLDRDRWGQRAGQAQNRSQNQLGEAHGQGGNFGQRQQPQGQSHRGKGPKGFIRSDERLKEDVSHQLEQAHEVDASEIEIRVQNGEATLTGTVADRTMKYRAEEIVEGVSGIKNVDNQIKVQRAQNDQKSTASSNGGTSTAKTTDKSKAPSA